MVETQTYELTPEMLDRWAAQFPERKLVATRYMSRSCPIAQMMLDAYSVDGVSADYDVITLFKTVEPTLDNYDTTSEVLDEFETPLWAIRFMRTVDLKQGKITAGSVRKTLQEVMAAEEAL